MEKEFKKEQKMIITINSDYLEQGQFASITVDVVELLKKQKIKEISFNFSEQTMENTCINVLSMEHGEKVIKYYKSLGVNTKDLKGGFVNCYYGVFDGKFDFNNLPGASKVIELPTDKEEKCNPDNHLTPIRFELNEIINKFIDVNKNFNLGEVTLEDASKITLYDKFIKEIIEKYVRK